MRRLRFVVPILALAAVLPLSLLNAGLPEYDATEIAVGDDPLAVTVTPDDRVVATLLGTDPAVLSWLDSADFSAGPSTIGLDGDVAGSLAAGTLGGEQVVFVGGSQLDVVRFDPSTTPATPSVDGPTGIVSGRLDALAWHASTGALYAIDGEGQSLRHFDLSGDEVAVDALSDDWPLALPFAATNLAFLDDDTLLSAGDDDGLALATVDLAAPAAPSLQLPTVDATPAAAPVGIASDGLGEAWLLLDDGQLWSVADSGATGDDDDSAAGDDDDSAIADDDDSAVGDDDDSALDVARGDDAADFALVLLATEQSPAAGVLHRVADSAGFLVTAGSNQVVARDEDGVPTATFSVSTEVTALAASSGDDGFVYVGIGGTGQLAVLSAGPWITIDSVTPLEISDVSESITVDFTVTFGAQSDATCDYSLSVDATIGGGGTPLTPTGTATDGETVQVVLSGEELPAGERRVFVFCADDDGDAGRASFEYSSTGLAAPDGLSLDADDGQITVSWDDDGIADTYVLYLSDDDFDDDESPTLCNSDSTICSPYTVVPGSTGDDDDSSADDDDDSAEERSDEVTVVVTGLTNGTRYWFAVAGRGSDGADGPRTSTLSAVPSARGGAAVLAGDTGGCSCNSSIATGVPAGVLFLLAVGPLLRRRRGARS